MQKSERLEEFKKTVNNKFNVYNSLFLNLPYRNIENVGMLIPLMLDQCQKGLKSGKNPKEILDSFFQNYVNLESEEERIDFMFRIIQYVERQVVLYDSVEDAAFPKLHEHSSSLSIKDYFQLVDKNKSWDKIADQLSNFSSRIVLTAHPTQFYTPAVLDIITKLRSLILEDNIEEIDIALQQLGLTSLINAKKPTPLDEAKNIIYILRNVYYDAIGDLYAYIKSNVGDHDFENLNIMKLGFWPGGDRDGNPFVTADITNDVADELRINLMKCYYNDLKQLQQKLTFKALQPHIMQLRDNLYTAMFNPKKTVDFEDIIGPLRTIRTLLIEKYHGLYLKDLEHFMDKVKIFKTHFATLDIRQDHSQHLITVETILKSKGFIKESIDELSNEELERLLVHEEITLSPEDFEEGIVRDTMNNITQLKAIQKKNGEDGCNRYIISNSEDVFSVLFVYGLFRWLGWKVDEITTLKEEMISKLLCLVFLMEQKMVAI